MSGMVKRIVPRIVKIEAGASVGRLESLFICREGAEIDAAASNLLPDALYILFIKCSQDQRRCKRPEEERSPCHRQYLLLTANYS